MAAPVSLRKAIPHRYEWLVPADDPWGAPLQERIAAGLTAATTAYREAYAVVDDAELLPRDALRVEKTGGDVVISFTVDEPAPVAPAPRRER